MLEIPNFEGSGAEKVYKQELLESSGFLDLAFVF